MSLPESAKDYFFRQYAANWRSLTRGNGLDGWLEWLGREDLDEYVFNIAFRELCEERREKKRFDADKDRPRLNEMQYHYMRVRDIQRAKGLANAASDDCDYCENLGFRYIVVHADGLQSTESIITALPATFRKFCYYFTIPCSCARGAEIQESRFKSGARPLKRFTHERQLDLLSRSFQYAGAQRLINSYNKVIHPNQKSDPQFLMIINQLKERMQARQKEVAG
jgi:hypothetical protein